jgi:hypothetical protein
MDWKTTILSKEQAKAQRLALVEIAIREIELAVTKLGALGHYVHVREGIAPPEEWPKALFNRFGYQKVVYCQADWDEIGPDWYESLEEARKAHGLDKQMERGGIFKQNLPDVVRSPNGEMRDG